MKADSGEIRQPDQLKHSYSIGSRVKIETVRLRSSRCRDKTRPDGLPEDVLLGRATRHELDWVSRKVHVFVRYSFQGNYPEETTTEENAPLQITGEYKVSYSIVSGDEPTSDELKAFSDLNGVYNTWPYWREFLQSMLMRMGLPVFTLPVLPPSPPQSLPVQKDAATLDSPSPAKRKRKPKSD